MIWDKEKARKVLLDVGPMAGNYPTQAGEGLLNLASVWSPQQKQKNQVGLKWDLTPMVPLKGVGREMAKRAVTESRAWASSASTHCCPRLKCPGVLLRMETWEHRVGECTAMANMGPYSQGVEAKTHLRTQALLCMWGPMETRRPKRSNGNRERRTQFKSWDWIPQEKLLNFVCTGRFSLRIRKLKEDFKTRNDIFRFIFSKRLLASMWKSD